MNNRKIKKKRNVEVKYGSKSYCLVLKSPASW